jgi:hypothetical protein
MRLVQTEEATEAEAAASQKSEEGQTQFRDAAAKLLQSKVEDLEIQVDGKTLKGEEAKKILTGIVAARNQNARGRNPRQEWKAFRMLTPMEFFFNGDDYQFRQPQTHFKSVDELADLEFSGCSVDGGNIGDELS